ncbi:hypothetical protein GE061_008331 [Apolygus lucorum]|uniref:Carboxylesterase type B domain-containing protein n=1 Tax=Apolygus lucorum TaxID=248454 RepID=A0A8S9WPK9_APOLU|nr:hypothetical protein GE061_008331 [Apolygus lucorum]
MWTAYVLAILLQGCLSQNLGNPILETPLGKMQGWERMSRDGRVYQAWTRVPFAQPPLGELRFMPPKAVEKWNGILNTTADLDPCLQTVTVVPYLNLKGSEDCLYLNVYRPKGVRGKPLPVLFSIFGGAFNGQSLGPREYADYIMDEDVIMVGINFRMNFFGFMTLGDKTFPGNFGMKDMVAALRWVKNNIASFGGDPNSVTLIGYSSGGMNVEQLLRSPLVEKEELVSRGFSDSGSENHQICLSKVDKIKKNSLQVIRAVGCDGNRSSEEIRTCLQSVDGADIIKAVYDLRRSNTAEFLDKRPFTPVIEPEDAEDNVIPEDLSLRKTSKPWITSTTNGEYFIYNTVTGLVPPGWFEDVRSNLTGYLQAWIGQHTNNLTTIEEGAQLLKKQYFQNMESIDNFTVDLTKMHGAAGFDYPFLFNIEKQKNNGPTWAYRMEYRGELSGLLFKCPGDTACHADTCYFYINFRSQFKCVSPIETLPDKAVSKRFIKYLVNFAYHNNPTPPGSDFIWEQYKGNEIMRMTKNGDFMADADFVSNLKKILTFCKLGQRAIWRSVDMKTLGVMAILLRVSLSQNLDDPVADTLQCPAPGWEKGSRDGRYHSWTRIPYSDRCLRTSSRDSKDCLNTNASQLKNLDGPIVDTPLGRVQGWERTSRDGRLYQAWTKIPYTQPPVGELRFMPPKPMTPWIGTLEATADPAPCLQKMSLYDAKGTENCLYLNVYRPKNRSGQALPVLFHIHGGAFQSGDIGPREMADYLMDQDVILVAIQYRLNFFGYMTLGDKIFPGNFGLKDQLTALRWVKKNIASFGGDPNSVTIFGESAGGQNSQHLLRSPLIEKEDLVSRAVSDSGSINHLTSLMNVDEVKANTLKVVRAVCCLTSNSSSEEIRKCLQTVDGADIMAAYEAVKPVDKSILPFAPVIEPKDAEDNIIPEDLSLRVSSKPWITSTANGEFLLYTLLGSGSGGVWLICSSSQSESAKIPVRLRVRGGGLGDGRGMPPSETSGE